MTWYVKKGKKRWKFRTKENASMALYAARRGISKSAQKYLGGKIIRTGKKRRHTRSRNTFGGYISPLLRF